MAVATLLGAACAGPPPKVAGVVVRLPTTTVPPPSPGDAPITAAPERFDGPAPAARPAPRRLFSGGSPGPGTWAVVIGINDYPGSAHDLRSAGADADTVDAALAGMGVPADHRLVLKDGQVTRQVLRAAAQWLVDRAGPDSVAVWAFAGHVRKTGRGTEAMVAADGGTVTDAELAQVFRGLRARQAWVVMAACFGGGFTEVLRPGVVLTGAAPADQEAYENLGYGLSYLVKYMVLEAMLEGRAPETVQSAFEYARSTISRDHPLRVPVQLDQAGGPLDLRPPGVAPPPRPARATSAPSAAAAPASSGDSAPAPAKTTTAPGGGAGGGTATARKAPPTTTTTTAPDRCQALTGMLTCGPREYDD